MMATECLVSAPGKVILNGEHAVVFGKHAIAVSVDLRTTVEVHADSEEIRLNLDNFNINVQWNMASVNDFVFGCFKAGDQLVHSPHAMARIREFLGGNEYEKARDTVQAFWFLYFSISDIYCGSKRIPMEVKIHSQLPVGAGLGSSAAFSVSLSGALLKAFNVDHSVPIVNQIAYQVEHIFHGKPSGIDTSICAFGGGVLFKSGQIQEKSSDLQLPSVILVYTNVTRNTKALVQMTTERRQAQPKVIELIMDAIDAISLSTWDYLKSKEHHSEIEVLAETNHHLLNAIGAGHQSIDNVVTLAKKYGFKAKLTGAGGGGTVVIYLKHGKKQLANPEKAVTVVDLGYKIEEVVKLKDELESVGFHCWQVPTGVAGLLTQ